MNKEYIYLHLYLCLNIYIQVGVSKCMYMNVCMSKKKGLKKVTESKGRGGDGRARHRNEWRTWGVLWVGG